MGITRILGLFGGLFELILSIPFVLLGIFLSKEKRIKRKIKKAKAKKINELRNGDYVKLQGTALPHTKIMTSPLSKQKCIGYQVVVGRSHHDSYDSNYIREEFIQNFYLQQGEQKILVIAKDAKKLLKMVEIGSSGLFKDANSTMNVFLRRHHTQSTNLGFNKSLDFKEGMIKEGDQITVVGKVTELKTKSNERHLVIRAMGRQKLYVKS